METRKTFKFAKTSKTTLFKNSFSFFPSFFDNKILCRNSSTLKFISLDWRNNWVRLFLRGTKPCLTQSHIIEIGKQNKTRNDQLNYYLFLLFLTLDSLAKAEFTHPVSTCVLYTVLQFLLLTLVLLCHG